MGVSIGDILYELSQAAHERQTEKTGNRGAAAGRGKDLLLI